MVTNAADETRAPSRVVGPVGVRKAGIALLLGLILATLAGCGDDGSGIGVDGTTVDLEERNDSGYHGAAQLVSAGSGDTTIVVAVGQDDVLEGDFQVSVNRGSCDSVTGNELFELGRLSAGTLTAHVPSNFPDLQTQELSIAVFASAERSLYVACGNL